MSSSSTTTSTTTSSSSSSSSSTSTTTTTSTTSSTNTITPTSSSSIYTPSTSAGGDGIGLSGRTIYVLIGALVLVFVLLTVVYICVIRQRKRSKKSIEEGLQRKQQKNSASRMPVGFDTMPPSVNTNMRSMNYNPNYYPQNDYNQQRETSPYSKDINENDFDFVTVKLHEPSPPSPTSEIRMPNAALISEMDMEKKEQQELIISTLAVYKPKAMTPVSDNESPKMNATRRERRETPDFDIPRPPASSNRSRLRQ